MKIKRIIKEIESPVPNCKAYIFGECRVFVGIEPNIGWHMSISHAKRYPTWDEIRDARYRFVDGNVTMAMLLPPKSEYVNLHPNCFHLHEFKMDNMKGQIG